MDKFSNWLQIVGNFAIVGGLIMVGFQINQNTQFHQADSARRAYEQVMQLNIAVMGENPAKALAKAATDPSGLTDEELLVLHAYSNWWIQNDTKTQTVLDMGATAMTQDQARGVLRSRAKNQHGGNRVAAAIWENWRDSPPAELAEWERIVDAEFRAITEYDDDANDLRYLRRAADGD